MKTFIKYNNLAFAIIFAAVTLVELYGLFVKHHVWCIGAACVTAFVTILFYDEYKQAAKE